MHNVGVEIINHSNGNIVCFKKPDDSVDMQEYYYGYVTDLTTLSGKGLLRIPKLNV